MSNVEGAVELLPETQALVDALTLDPFLQVACAFDGDRAFVIRQMSRGCAARNDVLTQPLCTQHNESREPIDTDTPAGDVLVVDLTLDGALSKSWGEEPMYFIARTPGGLALQQFVAAPDQA